MERSRHVFEEFIELCRKVTNNDSVVLKLLQKKYNQANRHFLWSDDFCQLVGVYSARVRDDPANKYVHIRDIVSELKAYKAKPLKQVIAPSHCFGVDSGHSSATDDSLPTKRIKMESVNLKQRQRPGAKAVGSNTPQSSPRLPPLVQHSSKLCRFLPLSTLSGSTVSVDDGRGECRLVEVTTDDTDSRSSFDDSQTSAVAVSCRDADDADTKTEPSLGSSVNNSQASREPDELQSPSEPSIDPVEHLSSNELNEEAKDDHSEPVACSSLQQQEAVSDRCQLKADRRIRYLEELLSRYHGKIKDLEEKELTLDDMDQEDSTYILIDRFKSKIMKIWNKLCTLKGRSSSTGRELEKPLQFEGTKYPEVNRLISRYVGKYHMFPDYHDIRDIIVRCNERHSLHIREHSVDAVAREAFVAVGNMLQTKRIKEFVSDFGCHLTDAVRVASDPAISNVNLRSKLDENHKVGSSRLNEVITKFANLQDNSSPVDACTADSGSDDDSQKMMTDVDDVLTTTDNVEDDADEVMQAESVAEAESSPTADTVHVETSVSVESSDQCKTCDNEGLDVSVSPTVASHSGDSMLATSSVVRSTAHAIDTAVTLSVSASATHPSATSSVVVPVQCTAVDITSSVTGSATHPSATPSVVKPVHCTAVSAAAAAGKETGDVIIDIVDDDDDILVTETTVSASTRVRETVTDKRHHRKTKTSQSLVSESPVVVSSSRLPAVISLSNAAASSANQRPAQTTKTATDRPPRPGVIGQPARSTAAQPDPPLPTARVIGRIVSIRGPSSLTHQSTAHRTSTTATQSTSATVTAVASSSMSNTVTVAPAAQMPVGPVTANAQSTSASNRSTARRGAGVRRAPRRRRVAVLRPEELYEISSQIVAEVLQRNRQQQQSGPTDPDVIDCDYEADDVDDVAVDVSDGRSGSSSCDDVMIVDEPAVTVHHVAPQSRADCSAGKRSRAQHSGAQRPGAKHSRAERTGTESSGTEHSGAKQFRDEHSRTQISGAERSRAQPPRAEPTGTEISGPEHYTTHHSMVPRSAAQHSRVERSGAEPSGAALCSKSVATPGPRKRLIIPASSHQLVNTAHSVTVVDADGSDDPEVIFCDDNPLSGADRSSVRPGPIASSSAATATAGTDNDEVLICDTPAPCDPAPAASTKSEHTKIQSCSTVGHSSSRCTTMASPQTSTSVNLADDSVASVSTTQQGGGLQVDDGVVILDADTSSVSDSQGNTDITSSGGNSSVIVLD